MNNEITLSVIVPSYNSENYIRQTLDSIVKQAMLYRTELIIGDDCSKDSTISILKDYQERYPHIVKVVYNQQNMGFMKNYFSLISRCKGKYIMVCAADDYWLPSKVEKQLSIMESDNEIGVVCSDAEFLVEPEKKIIKHSVDPNYKYNYDSLIFENHIIAVTTCFRSELMKKYMKEVKPLDKEWLMEDYPFLLWASQNTKIKYIDEKLAVYRIITGSISHSDSYEKQLRFEKSSFEVQQYFCKEGYEDIIRRSHLLRLSIIYLKNDDMKQYREVVKLSKGRFLCIKYLLSFVPMYSYAMKFFWRIRGLG